MRWRAYISHHNHNWYTQILDGRQALYIHGETDGEAGRRLEGEWENIKRNPYGMLYPDLDGVMPEPLARWPEGSICRQNTESEWPWRVLREVAAVVSQILMVLSWGPLARWPEGSICRQYTELLWPWRVLRHLPLISFVFLSCRTRFGFTLASSVVRSCTHCDKSSIWWLTWQLVSDTHLEHRSMLSSMQIMEEFWSRWVLHGFLRCGRDLLSWSGALSCACSNSIWQTSLLMSQPASGRVSAQNGHLLVVDFAWWMVVMAQVSPQQRMMCGIWTVRL